MHYHELPAGKQRLKIVVYKHGTINKPTYKKDDRLTKTSVDYDVTSIQECEFFRPSSLLKILKNPYEAVNQMLGKQGVEFEKYYLVTFEERWIQKSKGKGKIPIVELISSIEVNPQINPSLTIH